MARTPRSHPSYAALTALSAALLLSAAIDAPLLSSSRATAGGQVRLSAVDREALASLLSCLAEAARGLGEQKQAQAPALASPALAAALLPSASPPAETTVRPAATVMHRPELLNLPPPHDA